MIVLKIYYHTIAIIKKIFYKIIYGKHVKFGKKVTFRKGFSLVIEDGGHVEIGDGCFFNNYCSINAKFKIEIGENCLFGENVKIYDHNHIFKKKNKLIKEQGFKCDKIQIGKNCWIGSNSTILKNVKIGDNCVVSAQALLKNNIESESILLIDNTSSYKIEKILYT